MNSLFEDYFITGYSLSVMIWLYLSFT